jgi:Zn-finger in Ran binding protein and others
MYSFPPSLQSAPMPTYLSTAASQPTQAARSSNMPGSVPFRAGDWKCGSENCGYHNFAKNVTCLRCGASRAQAALIADSTGGLNTPVSMSSMSSMYSTSSHHPSESLGSSSFSSNQFPPSQAYPAPLPPSSNMSNQSYPPLGSQSYGAQNTMGGMGMSNSRGGPQMESGDWTCISCGYSNFRRRSNCLRCSSINPNLIQGGNMMGPPQSMMRSQQSQQPQLAMLDTSIVEPFLNEDLDKPPSHHSRVPQSAGAIPSSNFLTRSMNNLSLGPLTSQYGGHYGTIGGGPMTAPPGVSDDEYEYGSRSASAVDRLGSGGFFSHRPHDE